MALLAGRPASSRIRRPPAARIATAALLTEAQPTEKASGSRSGSRPGSNWPPRTWARSGQIGLACQMALPTRRLQGVRLKTKPINSGHARWPPGSPPPLGGPPQCRRRSPRPSHEGGDHHDVRNVRKGLGALVQHTPRSIEQQIRISAQLKVWLPRLIASLQQPARGRPPGHWSHRSESRPSTRPRPSKNNRCSAPRVRGAASKSSLDLQAMGSTHQLGSLACLRVDGAGPQTSMGGPIGVRWDQESWPRSKQVSDGTSSAAEGLDQQAGWCHQALRGIKAEPI